MVKKRSGLGKGLGALIPDGKKNTEKENLNKGEMEKIHIDMIKPNRDQPRKHFDQERLDVLAESIKNHGILQPIVVRPIDNGYEIVAGERRWRAAKNKDLKEVPCIVKDIDDEKLMELSLIENLQREDLNEIEEALAYKRLNEEFSMTQDKIGKIVGKSRPYIANTLRLLNLDEEVKAMIVKGDISGGHGRTLLRIGNIKLQKEIALKIVSEALTVRETEKLVSNLVDKKLVSTKKLNNKEKDSGIAYLEESLKEVLGTKVNIINGKKKGKIEIEYYSDEDLERIIEFLKK